MSGIQEKVVAITGASSDIGEAAARLLAARGAKVMLGALGISRLYALAHEIVEAGGSAHFQALDVTRPKSMQCFIEEATGVFGRVDVIVHADPPGTDLYPPEWVCDCPQIAISPDDLPGAIVLAIERPASANTGDNERSPRAAQLM